MGKGVWGGREMTSADMVAAVKARTHDSDDSKVLIELNAAQSWAYNLLYLAEGGPDLLITYNKQITLGSALREYDLATDATILPDVFQGLKRLWLKLVGETKFTQMTQSDSSIPQFVDDVDDTTTAAHPVFYTVENFSKLRFGALLPTGAILRVDYFRVPPAIDPTLNNTLANGSDLPVVVHQVLVDYATGLRYVALDDDRASGYISTASNNLQTALYSIRRRVQGPTTTVPYRAGRSRRFI